MLGRAHLAIDATLVLLLLADSTAQRFFAVAIPWALFTLWVVLDGYRAQAATGRKDCS